MSKELYSLRLNQSCALIEFYLWFQVFPLSLGEYGIANQLWKVGLKLDATLPPSSYHLEKLELNDLVNMPRVQCGSHKNMRRFCSYSQDPCSSQYTYLPLFPAFAAPTWFMPSKWLQVYISFQEFLKIGDVLHLVYYFMMALTVNISSSFMFTSA